MKRKSLQILSLIVMCQILFFGMSLKTQAIPVGVYADAPSFLKWAKDFMIQITWTSMKKQAINSAVAQVTSTIGGGAGGAKFIVDWRDALETQPGKATGVQMQNLFLTLGKGRNGSYAAVGGGVGYAGSMLESVKNTVMSDGRPEVVNLSEYGVNNPSQIFANQRNLRAFMTAYGSTGKIGNRVEATLYAQGQKRAFEETNQRLAQSQAIANGGYYSKVDNNGQVVTPGASIRDLMASAQNMSFAALANAQTIQEVTGALISRVVVNVSKKGIAASGRISGSTGNRNSGSSSPVGASVQLKGSFGDLSVGTN